MQLQHQLVVSEFGQKMSLYHYTTVEPAAGHSLLVKRSIHSHLNFSLS